MKQQVKEARNSLQKGIYVVIDPFVRLLIRMHITPNIVTTIGLLGNLAAAVLMVVAATKFRDGFNDYSLITISGALVIGFSLFDMLDGQVARIGKMSSVFGALYDSVLDRYCELFTLGAIEFFMLCNGSVAGAILTFLALVGSIMVSYVRARAEGLGIECKNGFMQRPERVVVTSLALLATGIAGQSGATNPDVILTSAMGFIAFFANLTAIARIRHCYKSLNQKQ